MTLALIPLAVSFGLMAVLIATSIARQSGRLSIREGDRTSWAALCRKVRRAWEEGKPPHVAGPPTPTGDFGALKPEDRWAGYRLMRMMKDGRMEGDAMMDLISGVPCLQAEVALYLAATQGDGAFLPLCQAMEKAPRMVQPYLLHALASLRPPPVKVLMDLAASGRSHYLRLALVILPRCGAVERKILLQEVLARFREEHGAAFLRYVQSETDTDILEGLFFQMDAFPEAIQEGFMDLFFKGRPIGPYAGFIEGRLSHVTPSLRLRLIPFLGRHYSDLRASEALGFWHRLKTEQERLRFLRDFMPKDDRMLEFCEGVAHALTPLLAERVVLMLRGHPTERALGLLMDVLRQREWEGPVVLKALGVLESFPRPLALQGGFQMMSSVQNPSYQDLIRKMIAGLDRS